jgi:hypothetical protein
VDSETVKGIIFVHKAKNEERKQETNHQTAKLAQSVK